VVSLDMGSFRRKGWYERARCAGDDMDKDWWSEPSEAIKILARHICLNHCPVLAECGLQAKPGIGMTEAGVSYTGKGKSPQPMSPQPDVSTVKCFLCSDGPPVGILYHSNNKPIRRRRARATR